MSRHTASAMDEDFLGVLRVHPQRGWQRFIERYADCILFEFRKLGLDRDRSMDGFVYVLEKLSENDYRRLKSIRYLKPDGDLTPWVRQVVRRLSVNWTWSVLGRRRHLKAVAALPALDRRVFELHFWHGLGASAIYEQLRSEHKFDGDLFQVLGILDAIFVLLTPRKRWRLLSRMAQNRNPDSLDECDPVTGACKEVPASRPDPERVLIQHETNQRVDRALNGLSPRQRLILQFTYEEGLGSREIACLLRIAEADVKKLLKSGLRDLRERLSTGGCEL